MRKRMRNNWWTTYWGYLLCNLLGHKEPGTYLEQGSEFCDCGDDHTYVGCSRCRSAF